MISKPVKSAQKDEAIVLRTQDLRESDLLVTMLTKSFGKISVTARGARRSKKRFMGGLDLFDIAQFDFTIDENDLSALGSLSSQSERLPLSGLRTDLRRFQLASLCTEIADQFSPAGYEDAGAYYDGLKNVLTELNSAETEAELLRALSGFLFDLLGSGGYDILSSGRPDLIYAARPDAEAAEMKAAIRDMISYIEELLGRRLRTRQGINFL